MINETGSAFIDYPNFVAFSPILENSGFGDLVTLAVFSVGTDPDSGDGPSGHTDYANWFIGFTDCGHDANGTATGCDTETITRTTIHFTIPPLTGALTYSHFFGVPDAEGVSVAPGTGFLHLTLDPPLPPALPLFATGLGVMGWLAWRKKRKDLDSCSVLHAGRHPSF
jgi:hypothetical protein